MTEHSNDEWVLVPKSAIDWLMGEAPDSAGYWFGEFPEGYVPVGRFWWRDHFDALIAAAPTPPSTDRIAALEAERRIRKAGQVAIDDLIDRIDGTHPGNDDLADYMTRIVDACVRAALKGASHDNT